MIAMKYRLLALMLCIGTVATAQESLVENGDFEEAVSTRNLKNRGMIDELCENWKAGTEAMADYYSTGVKGTKAAVPVNDFGSQSAASGNRYAGIVAYSKDTKRYQRQYLVTELEDNLEKDITYCMSFKVSLADLSKYAVSGLGVFVSDKKVFQGNKGNMIKTDNVVRHRSNKVMQSMDQWEVICGTFVATGEEEYIVIGNFESDSKLDIAKVKRPKGMTGTQIQAAYYYIDDVEVRAITAPSECACTPADEQTPDVIFTKKNVANEEELSIKEQIANRTVYFASLKAQVNGQAKLELNKLAELMKSNPEIRLEVVGHIDADENKEAELNPIYANLGKRRADIVVRYLISQGVNEMRLVPKSMGNTQPANERPTPLAKAQNRRVEFVVR